MAKEILVTESLTDPMIKAGAKLVQRLDSANSEVQSAFWLYYSDDRIWKLILASPLVDSLGPREYYKKVISANEEALDHEEVISLNDISVVSITDQLVSLLRTAIATGGGLSGIRFSRNTINGNFIEDCYIYRSN
jgi:hypothetical protein